MTTANKCRTERRNAKRELFTTSLPLDVAAALREQAHRERIALSAVIRRAIVRALEVTSCD